MLIREMIVPFLTGTVVLLLLFQANAYIYVAKQFNLDYVPVLARLQFILFSTPQYLEMTLPVGSAFAAALLMTRIARESELTALRANGASIRRVVLPIAMFGVLAGVANYIVVEQVKPVATKKANGVIQQPSALGLGMPTITTNKPLQLGRFAVWLGGITRNRATDQLTINDALLIDRDPKGVNLIVTAQSGTYDQGVWTFPNARLTAVKGIDITPIESKKLVINEKIVIDQLYGPPTKDDMSMKELREAIRAGGRTGQEVKALDVEYHKRFAVPTACLVFTVIAPIFAVMFSKTGGFAGILLTFIVVLIYYNSFIISTEILSKVEWFPGWLAAWLPNIFFSIVAAIAYRRLE